MAQLVLASLAWWVVIFGKRQMSRCAESGSRKFEKQFWSGVDLNRLYETVEDSNRPRTGMEAIFADGFREFSRLRSERQVDSAAMVDGAQRAMRVRLIREMDRLDNRRSFFATFGLVIAYV